MTTKYMTVFPVHWYDKIYDEFMTNKYRYIWSSHTRTWVPIRSEVLPANLSKIIRGRYVAPIGTLHGDLALNLDESLQIRIESHHLVHPSVGRSHPRVCEMTKLILDSHPNTSWTYIAGGPQFQMLPSYASTPWMTESWVWRHLLLMWAHQLARIGQFWTRSIDKVLFYNG